jgi:hypothetical protein
MGFDKIMTCYDGILKILLTPYLKTREWNDLDYLY